MRRYGFQLVGLLLLVHACPAALATDSPLVAKPTAAQRTLQPLVSVVNSPGRSDNAPWRATTVPVDAPLGNPLADPLAFSPAERQLFTDAEDGHLDEHSLIDAALIACGVEDPASRDRYRKQFDVLREESASGIPHSPFPIPHSEAKADGRRQKAEDESTSPLHPFTPSPLQNSDEDKTLRALHEIHGTLHHRLLSTYDANATSLSGVFDTGVYNCASATLLFIALADQFGLTTNAIELPGHVRVEATAGDDRYEIEITCPNWSDAVRRLEPSPSRRGQCEGAAASNEKSSTLTPTLSQRERGPCREISPPGLIALIYYNRGIDAFYEGRYVDAVAANRRALLLDPVNQTARGNMLAAVNNWALALADAGRYAEAEELLSAGLCFDPTHEPFMHNAEHVRQLKSRTTASSGF